MIPISTKSTKNTNMRTTSLILGSLLCVAVGAGMTGVVERYYSGPVSVNAAEGQTSVPAVTQGLPT